MATNSKSRSNKSLYEKSMKMVSNIMKLSSFYIAKMSLGTPPPTRKHSSSVSSSVKVTRTTPVMPPPRFYGTQQRAQEPTNSSKPVSYLMEPIQGKGSSVQVVHETSVDKKAWDYIRKVHDNNRAVLGEAATISPFILPPLLILSCRSRI